MSEELNLGAKGAGDDCFDKVVKYGGVSAVAGGCRRAVDTHCS